jgi:histone deacetylase 1/2
MSSHYSGGQKKVVSYFYEDDVGNYMYKQEHPMKPFRVRMTNELICAYGLDKQMKRMEIEQEYIENVDFTLFHSDDYIDVLKNITLENKDLYAD